MLGKAVRSFVPVTDEFGRPQLSRHTLRSIREVEGGPHPRECKCLAVEAARYAVLEEQQHGLLRCRSRLRALLGLDAADGHEILRREHEDKNPNDKQAHQAMLDSHLSTSSRCGTGFIRSIFPGRPPSLRWLGSVRICQMYASNDEPVWTWVSPKKASPRRLSLGRIRAPPRTTGPMQLQDTLVVHGTVVQVDPAHNTTMVQ